MKRRIGLSLVVMMVAMVLAMPQVVPAADYKPEYKLSLVLGKPFPWGVGGERWAELIKEKSGGRINVKAYPGTSLVGEIRPRSSLPSGRAPLTWPSARPSTGRPRYNS